MKNKLKMRWGMRDENDNHVYVVFEATSAEIDRMRKTSDILRVHTINLLRDEKGVEYSINGGPKTKVVNL